MGFEKSGSPARCSGASRSVAGYVYLLRVQDSTDFKIGIAIDVYARAIRLPEKIKLAESFRIECTALPASRIEQVLHTVFHQFRLNTHEGDGRTEWFDGACFEDVLGFLLAHGRRLGCSEPKPIPIPVRPVSNHTSRAEARYQRRVKWEREKARSIQVANTVLSNCLYLLQTAMSSGALRGCGHWTNRYGAREKFVVFDAAPESQAWAECLESVDPCVRPFIHVCYDERDGQVVGQCRHNYILCSKQLARVDGSGWYVLERPNRKLMTVTPLFRELDSFLESIPPLTAYAVRKGRDRLRESETQFREFWCA
jgi:T5orf172 domain-containing protein